MEDSFGINNVALVDGQPRTLGLKQMLQVYVEHRLRRSSAAATPFRLGNKKADRLHLVEGLLHRARSTSTRSSRSSGPSDDSAAAQERLMSVFDLTELQAEYILETAAAPADPLLPPRAGEGAGDAAQGDRGARRDPRRRRACSGRSSRPSWPRWRRPTAPRAAPSCWSRPAPPPSPRRPRRSRSPTTRASLCSPPPACSRARRAPTSSEPAAAGPTTTWSSPPCVRRPAPTSACSPRPGGCCAWACSTCRRSRRRPTSPTCRAGCR